MTQHYATSPEGQNMTSNLKPARWILAALLPLLIGAGGTLNAATGIDSMPESRIWVGGTSSMRGWECKATTFELKLDAEPNAVASTLAGTMAVTGATLAIPTEKLECGNGTMNGHLKKALKAEEHPQIEFRLTSHELLKSGDSVNVTIKGVLTLGGTEKEIEIAAIATPAADGALRIAATYPLKMTEFGLKPPTMMFGRMKVGDLVKVGFDLVLKDGAQ